jgi:hypothetical protein
VFLHTLYYSTTDNWPRARVIQGYPTLQPALKAVDITKQSATNLEQVVEVTFHPFRIVSVYTILQGTYVRFSTDTNILNYVPCLNDITLKDFMETDTMMVCGIDGFRDEYTVIPDRRWINTRKM